MGHTWLYLEFLPLLPPRGCARIRWSYRILRHWCDDSPHFSLWRCSLSTQSFYLGSLLLCCAWNMWSLVRLETPVKGLTLGTALLTPPISLSSTLFDLEIKIKKLCPVPPLRQENVEPFSSAGGGKKGKMGRTCELVYYKIILSCEIGKHWISYSFFGFP